MRSPGDLRLASLQRNLVYYLGFLTLVSLVFYGFGMHSVLPEASITGEHAIDLVWLCIMIVYGSVIQLIGTYMLVTSYAEQAHAASLEPSWGWMIAAWAFSLLMVLTFAVIYPVLFYAIKV